MENQPMDVITAINSRRSIRRYTEEPISDGDLHTILTAGLAAPSATNRRPIHIIVIQKKETLQLLSAINSHGKMIEKAAVCLVVVADRNAQPVKELYLNDGSAVIENILVAVNGIGLGAVWIGVYHFASWYNELLRITALPENMIPVGLIAVGHPDEKKVTGDRYDPAKIHQEIF